MTRERMPRRKVTVIGRRERRRDRGPADRRIRHRGCRPGGHRRGVAAGKGPRPGGGRAAARARPPGGRHQRLRGYGGLGRHRRHVRHRPAARDEPGRPAAQERRDREVRRRAGGRLFAERGDHHRHEPARRDVPRRAQGVRVPALARDRMAGVLDSARFRTFVSMELAWLPRTPPRSCSAGMATPWCLCRGTRRSVGFRSRS